MKEKILSLLKSQGFIRYSKNTFWLLFEKLFRIVMSLFIGVWVARYLGPEKFGKFNFAISFVALFSFLSSLGLDKIAIRELVINKEKEKEILGTIFCLKFMGSIAVLVLIAITLSFTDFEKQINLLILIICLSTFFQSFNALDYFFQSKVMSKYIVYSNIITLIIGGLLKIIFIINEAPLIFFAYVILIESAVFSLGLVYYYLRKKEFKIHQYTFRFNRAKMLLKNSWPLILSGIMVTTYMKIDQIMIRNILGDFELGQYSAATRISESLYFLPVIISSSFFPAILNAKNKNTEQYYDRIQSLLSFVFWIFIIIAIPLTFFSKFIFNFLYGGDYPHSASVFIIHIWTGIFVGFGMVSHNWYIAENLQILTFYRSFFGVLSNIVLNLFLIETYGIIGAAISTLVSQIVSAYLFDLSIKKTRKIFFMKSKTLFASGLWSTH